MYKLEPRKYYKKYYACPFKVDQLILHVVRVFIYIFFYSAKHLSTKNVTLNDSQCHDISNTILGTVEF